MISSKKGMGIGQVFIFIIAAISFSLIMIFGYKAITGFMQSGEDVEFVQFKTDLESSIKKIYTEFGSVRVEEYKTPVKYDQICFINLDHKPTEDELNELCNMNQIACSVWEDAIESGYDNIDENVFLTPTAPVKIKVHRMSFDNEDKNYLCTKIVNGNFKIVLEGKGDRTELSPVPLGQ